MRDFMTPFSKMPRKCSFQDQWQMDVKYEGWICRDQSKHCVCCTVCCIQFSLAAMGEAALRADMMAMQSSSEKTKFGLVLTDAARMSEFCVPSHEKWPGRKVQVEGVTQGGGRG